MTGEDGRGGGGEGAGEEFGQYRLLRLIGQGGMGEVWRAHDRVRRRDVALKRITGPLSRDTELRARFRREAHLAARLTSPHVVPIHDFGEVDGRLYLDMRLVHGPDLRTVLDDLPYGVEPWLARELVGQLADALDEAHDQGLVHRDVKPSNVLLDPARGRWFCYLTDFGVALPVGIGDEQDTRITLAGTTVGTPAYMAPELLVGDGRAAVGSDVYALGCLLYEMLTGGPPFADRSPAAVFYHHVNTAPPSPSSVRPSLEPFDGPVLAALAKDPARRFHSAGELARALPLPAARTPDPRHGRETLVPGPRDPGPSGTGSSGAPAPGGATPPAAPAPPGGPTPDPVPVREPSSGRRSAVWVLVLAGVLLLGAAAGTVALWSPSTPAAGPTVSAVPVPTTVSAERLPLAFDVAYDVVLDPGAGRAYVVGEAGAPSLSVVDTEGRRVLRRIPVREGATQLALSADGSRAYVTVAGNDSDPGDRVQVVDLAAGRTIAEITVGQMPAYPVVSPDGTRLYVSVPGAQPENTAGALVTIDTTRNTVLTSTPVGLRPAQVALSPDGGTAYVANWGNTEREGGNSVSVVDTGTGAVLRTVPTRQDPYGLALSPDGRTLYVGTNSVEPSGTLDLLDTTSFARTEVAPAGLSGPSALAVGPDGTRLIMPSFGTEDAPGSVAAVLDGAGQQVGSPARIDGRPRAAALTPDGHHAWVAAGDPGGLWLVGFP